VCLRGADDDDLCISLLSISDLCISLMMRFNNAWLLAFRILTWGKK
jgi:hypothetical protein